MIYENMFDSPAFKKFSKKPMDSLFKNKGYKILQKKYGKHYALGFYVSSLLYKSKHDLYGRVKKDDFIEQGFGDILNVNLAKIDRNGFVDFKPLEAIEFIAFCFGGTVEHTDCGDFLC